MPSSVNRPIRALESSLSAQRSRYSFQPQRLNGELRKESKGMSDRSFASRWRWLRALAVFVLLFTYLGVAARPAQAAPSDLFFSEYIEGSSNNKALEIYNGTGAAIDLGANGYNIQMFFNGSASVGLTINLTGSVVNGDVFVLAQASASAAILAQADQTSTANWYNGDDAVVLRKGTTVLDVIGQIGLDPGTEWGTGVTSTADNTLRRKLTIETGDPNGGDVFDPSVEWDGFTIDIFDGLGCYSGACVVTPSLAINDVSANEGNSGTTSFDFTVNLSTPAGAGGVTFDIATQDNTATVADNDYAANALTGQTIPAGSSSYMFSVLVNGDTATEPDETFFVNVTNVVGATAADGQGQGTIVNDDSVATTFIHDIQGSGGSAAAGTFTVEAIVVGSYQAQGSGRLRGFFLQEENADADTDPATSEGIFVFCTTCPVQVSVGDKVRATGTSSESFGMSQLTASTVESVSVLSSDNPLPTPASVQLPVPGVPSGDLALATAAINAYFEAFEGMLVTFPDTLSVSEYFELARYGQVILSEGGRPHTFTAANTPTAAGFINHEINLASRSIILDDTDNRQNRPSDVPNTAYYHPVPGLSISNYFRGGDTITNLTGVLHWSFAGQTGTDAWRIRPVTEAYNYAFTPVNTRPAVPTVDGSLKVASFNVLNYFLTIDTSNTCAPTLNQDCRGADSEQELERQRTKMLAALSAIDADVFGFMEMENSTGVEPLADIVSDLPGYAYIDTGVIGTDAIRVGIIYKTTTVQPVGDYAILDSSVDPRFVDTRNRPALAQTFEEIATGGRVTVVVNHLKSKGSGCGAGDDDTTTGQGNCNGTRTLAAEALADWLATDPTDSGDSDVLIIGDLNSYAKEDPILALQDAGYTDLVATFGGPSAYGYVFDGQLGYLDHALANSSLNPQVADVAEWHINADEIPLFDYNDDVRTADEATFEEESDTLPLYEPNEFRTSDHDPVIVGLNLTTPNSAPVANADSYSVAEDAVLTVPAPGVLANDTDANNDTLTATLVNGPSHGMLTLNPDGSFSYTPAANHNGSDSFTYKANDGTADSGVASVSINITLVNDAPVAAAQSVTASEDTAKVITLVATDVDNDPLSYSYTQPAHGTVTGSGPNVTYTPAANYNGADSFTFKANDGTADSNSVTVSITVNAINDAPVANPDSASVKRGKSVTINVRANDTDVENHTLTVIAVSPATHGSVTLNANGTVKYTAPKSFTGTDTFTYTISDGQGGTATATVTVTVSK
jgi:VCBS repeat-containing protein